jgi:hypothetical protein
MAKKAAVLTMLLVVLILPEVQGQETGEAAARSNAVPRQPTFVLIRPTPAYNARLRTARASYDDYFWDELQRKHEDPTYENVKDFLAPLKYVNAPWRYFGVILSPKGSTEKMRVTEIGSRVDAGLTRRMPWAKSQWVLGNTHLWIYVGPQNELFGLDEHRQEQPHYLDGYLPILQTGYRAGGTNYEETVLASHLIAEHRSPYIDEPGIAAYIRVTAQSGPGEVAFQVQAPPVTYGGFLGWPGGFRDDEWTDGQNNVYAWFSPGAHFNAHSQLVQYQLAPGQSAYVIFPHSMQLAGTVAQAGPATFTKALAKDSAVWQKELAQGGQIEVPEKRVMDAYRSLLIGDWQVSIGDELPYSMFSSYEGNAYVEILQNLTPFIEYGYFSAARRFIQPILEYPLSDTGIGFRVCANQLELAAYYYALSGDAAFIRKNKHRLLEVANYFLAHRRENTGFVIEGYENDFPNERVVNLATNSNGWRAIRDLGLTLNAISEGKLGSQYLAEARVYGDEVRKAVLDDIDHSTHPPFVPYALGTEKPYKSLVESEAASYYNVNMPYFFESEIFNPNAAPYTDVLEYMWHHQGVMAGLQRFDQHTTTFAQDGIHPIYTWGRQLAQIDRHEARRVVYTFYCALAHAYTRGTYLTGECQGTVPSKTEWYRRSYLPPEPPANALLLRSLRHMLIHENDRNQDGIHDDMWLLSAIPKGWLADGESISLKEMPSRFGPVSLKIQSALNRGKLTGEVALSPGIRHKQVLLFLRLPDGHRVLSASLKNGFPLKIGELDGDAFVTLPSKPGNTRFIVAVK